ncbi:MAG: hypothetical protein QOG62_998 [Thermoleophilaceae bacterium]|nr:hypothetical protein [Thermoleophilaceae bacterium]
MSRRDQLFLLGLAALTTVVLAVVALLGAHELLHALPLLVLLLPLLGGRYLGEERLIVLVRSHAARRPVRAARATRPVRAPIALPRGGRLIATSLAVRPPPAVFA